MYRAEEKVLNSNQIFTSTMKRAADVASNHHIGATDRSNIDFFTGRVCDDTTERISLNYRCEFTLQTIDPRRV